MVQISRHQSFMMTSPMAVLFVLFGLPFGSGFLLTGRTSVLPFRVDGRTSCLRAELRSSGYIREPGDVAEVSTADVERLLCERSEARSARDWKTADAIRDTLGDMGVTVQDNEMIWFVSTGRQRRHSGGNERRVDLNDGNAYTKREFFQEYGGYREWDMSPPYADQGENGGRGGGVDQGRARGDWRQRRRERDMRRMANRSRAYTRAPECTAALDVSTVRDIEALVEQRLRKKLDRRFNEADALLAELEAKGVAISDDARSWRADGLSFVYEYRCVRHLSQPWSGLSAQPQTSPHKSHHSIVSSSFQAYRRSGRSYSKRGVARREARERARGGSVVERVRQGRPHCRCALPTRRRPRRSIAYVEVCVRQGRIWRAIA